MKQLVIIAEIDGNIIDEKTKWIWDSFHKMKEVNGLKIREVKEFGNRRTLEISRAHTRNLEIENSDIKKELVVIESKWNELREEIDIQSRAAFQEGNEEFSKVLDGLKNKMWGF